jgi:hypothetical protein
MISPSSGTHSIPLISTPFFQGCRVILAADRAVGYQQRHLDVARKSGPRFTGETSRLADDHLTRFGQALDGLEACP